jgi:hypothetical protein
MRTNFHRFALAILLAVALFCVTAHYATPAACCTQTSGSGCGCQSGVPDQDAGIHPCLACMLETGVRYQQVPHIAPPGMAFSKPIWLSFGTPVEPIFGVFHPPILSL